MAMPSHCGGHDSAHASGHGSAAGSSVQSFGVAGMTCEHCVRSVTEELAAYPEVPAMLAALKRHGMRTAVLSNGSPSMLEQGLGDRWKAAGALSAELEVI